jgi:lysophospholipase L1-like esterase
MEILWEDEIRRFGEMDRDQPPEQGRIVFLGSSILRMWDASRFFPDIAVYNRSFGGARTWEINHYYPRILPHLKPSLLVYYCGSNDLCSGRNHEQVIGGFQEFLGLFRKDFPRTRVLYLSILRSPAKKSIFSEVNSVNRAVSEMANGSEVLDFLDLNPALCDGGEDPVESYFVEDMNHLKESAYVRMSRLLLPKLSAGQV